MNSRNLSHFLSFLAFVGVRGVCQSRIYLCGENLGTHKRTYRIRSNVRHIWCRHYYVRPIYCRSNSSYKKYSVEASIVDLSNVGANTLELVNVDTIFELILDLNL